MHVKLHPKALNYESKKGKETVELLLSLSGFDVNTNNSCSELGPITFFSRTEQGRIHFH